jgi:hypothetical protein
VMISSGYAFLWRESVKLDVASSKRGPMLRRRPGWALLGHMGCEVRWAKVKALG